MDLSLTNPRILSFLEGKSDDAPVGEFMYIHTHFIQNNFVSQIESLILEASEILMRDKNKNNSANRLLFLAEQLALQVGEISETSAETILDIIKQLYQICKVFTEQS